MLPHRLGPASGRQLMTMHTSDRQVRARPAGGHSSVLETPATQNLLVRRPLRNGNAPVFQTGEMPENTGKRCRQWCRPARTDAGKFAGTYIEFPPHHCRSEMPAQTSVHNPTSARACCRSSTVLCSAAQQLMYDQSRACAWMAITTRTSARSLSRCHRSF